MADVGVARRGRARLVLLGVGVLATLYLASSLVWPNVVPRLALLPRPARTSWYDGCNWHGRSYEHGAGIFWIHVEDQTTRACPEGGLPEDDALTGNIVARRVASWTLAGQTGRALNRSLA